MGSLLFTENGLVVEPARASISAFRSYCRHRAFAAAFDADRGNRYARHPRSGDRCFAASAVAKPILKLLPAIMMRLSGGGSSSYVRLTAESPVPPLAAEQGLIDPDHPVRFEQARLCEIARVKCFKSQVGEQR